MCLCCHIQQMFGTVKNRGNIVFFQKHWNNLIASKIKVCQKYKTRDVKLRLGKAEIKNRIAILKYFLSFAYICTFPAVHLSFA